jgi:putative protease
MPELLAPAGNLEKLKWAVAYGADSVYFGLEFGSLRNFAGNFSLEEAKEGLLYLHRFGKRGYAALNIYPFSDEYSRLLEEAFALEEMGVDGVIVSDIGLLTALKEKGFKTPIHISTQANTLSWQTALAYKNLGAARVNLARELSFEQISAIQKHVKGQIETEVFIHGAVCFSYSGRCAVSDYMTGFRANRGECKHPCRYQYFLVEEKRPGKYIPVFEDNRGLYLFNTKDLALFEYVPRLAELGISSFKIEGRMKSIHYIAAIVSFYRQLLDGKSLTKEQALEWLNRVPNRGYTAGFLKGTFLPEDYAWDKSVSEGTSRFVANVETSGPDRCTIRVRNTIYSAETLEVLMPDGSLLSIQTPHPLKCTDGSLRETVQSGQCVELPCSLPEYSILRRIEVESR